MTGPAPVFVYGALRSGTTLFRLMLNSHPGIHNPGEVDFLFDFLHRDATHPTGWRYDTAGMQAHRIFRDKALRLPDGLDGLDLLRHMLADLAARHPDQVLTLNVHRHAEKIVETVPEARLIHLLRDPRDVARSCVGMGWNGISYYGINAWLKTERDWSRAADRLARMAVFEVRFETLMSDVEETLHGVCVFLGVPFSPDMLRYYENTSYAPPNPSLANQWQRKASPGEIALLEGRCGDLLVARGYAPSGPPDHPGAIRRLLLWVQNRLLRWRYNVRRFGAGLFLAGHSTRLLGLNGAHRSLAEQMEQKRTQGRR